LDIGYRKNEPVKSLKKLLFILGCPRSGTSILGELFECIPNVNYFFEPGNALEKIESSDKDFVIIKNPVDPPETCTPGLSLNLENYKNYDYEVLWIIRHPLDTICSLLPGLSEGWYHWPRPPKDFWKELSPLDRATYMWNWTNGEGFNNCGGKRVIHYEFLVEDPKQAVFHVLEWYDLEKYFPLTEEYRNKISNIKGGYEAKFQSYWNRGSNDRRINRYEKELKNTDSLWDKVQDISNRFHYFR
jgi:hypothetical protein